MTDTQVLISNTTQASHTGDTTETALATYTLPANTLPSNGALRIITFWSRSGSGGVTTIRVRLGGTSGTQYLDTTISASSAGAQGETIIYANSSVTAQKGLGTASVNPWAGSVNPTITSAVDTTSNADIVISGQCANAGDSIKLEAYAIELLQ